MNHPGWSGLARAKAQHAARHDHAWHRETEPFECDLADDPNEPTGLEAFEAAERAREEADEAWSRDMQAKVEAVMNAERAALAKAAPTPERNA